MFLSRLMGSPLYLFLFGSGGTLIIVLTVISLLKKSSRISAFISKLGKDAAQKNETPHNHTKAPLPESPSPIEEYDEYPFHSDEFFVTFLKTVEEKKKGEDIVEYR